MPVWILLPHPLPNDRGARNRSWRDEHSEARAPRADRYRWRVGYNPFRPHVAHRGDVFIIAATLVIVVALVLWATGVL